MNYEGMRYIRAITILLVAWVAVGCFKDTVGYTDFRIAVYSQAGKDDDFVRAEDVSAYAYYVDTTEWAIRSYDDALIGRITNKVTGEVREQPDVWGELNTSDEYQISLIINQNISMLVLLNPELKLYAYRKYQLPENLPRVDTKIYMAGWKPSQAASGWRVVNQFYQK